LGLCLSALGTSGLQILTLAIWLVFFYWQVTFLVSNPQFFAVVYVTGVCHCIRIKDCLPFVRLLLNHKLEDRATIYSMVHSAGCGFQGLDPLVCCPQHHESSLHNTRLIRFAPPRDRWVWDAPASSKPNPGFNRFMAYETEMHLLDHWDFQAQRNCPQPLDDEDYDEHYFGHHFEYQIDHGVQPKSQTW